MAGWLEQAVNQYFVHILLLVTDNNSSWMIQQNGENDRRNYFMINLHESMGRGQDRTHNQWIWSQTPICCQTGYQLLYAAKSLLTFFKINFFKKFFQEHYQWVKRFGSKSGPTFCRSWSGSKLFAKVISRWQKSSLARNELSVTLSLVLVLR